MWFTSCPERRATALATSRSDGPSTATLITDAFPGRPVSGRKGRSGRSARQRCRKPAVRLRLRRPLHRCRRATALCCHHESPARPGSPPGVRLRRPVALVGCSRQFFLSRDQVRASRGIDLQAERLEFRYRRLQCSFHPGQPRVSRPGLNSVHLGDEVCPVGVGERGPEPARVTNDLRNQVEVLHSGELVCQHPELLVCRDLLEVSLGQACVSLACAAGAPRYPGQHGAGRSSRAR